MSPIIDVAWTNIYAFDHTSDKLFLAQVIFVGYSDPFMMKT